MNDTLKNEVKTYWNKASCGTDTTQQLKHSLAYFEEIEDYRYRIEKEIFSFAQFTRFKNQKLLEVGVGAGTDFLQWVRAGTHAHGVDLTPEAIANTQARLTLYGLQAEDLRVADAENLPYPDNFFDIVYSWGVIHHSPDTSKCLQEIVRVTRPGGIIKIMIYNRYSIYAFCVWIRHALLRGKPFKSLHSAIYNHQESLGTTAYTKKEVINMIKKYNVTLEYIDSAVCANELWFFKKLVRWPGYIIASLFGWWKLGWFMKIELRKKI